MLLSLRKNGLTSLFKEVRVFKVVGACLATGDRIFATGSDSVSKLFCDPVPVFA